MDRIEEIKRAARAKLAAYHEVIERARQLGGVAASIDGVDWAIVWTPGKPLPGEPDVLARRQMLHLALRRREERRRRLDEIARSGKPSDGPVAR
jgi:hypothetical protein